MTTTRQTVRNLFQNIVNKLGTRGLIEVDAEKRQPLVEEIVENLGTHVQTDEDIRLRAIESIGERVELLEDVEFTESERFRTAKRMIRKTMGDDELHGLFFLITLRELAERLTALFLSSKHVEEVFGSDEELQTSVVEAIQQFRPGDAH